MKNKRFNVVALLVPFLTVYVAMFWTASFWFPSELVSEFGSGTSIAVANNVSGPASLSSDGRYVAFGSIATNLGAATTGADAVYWRDTCTGSTAPPGCTASTKLISLATSPAQQQICRGPLERPSISRNGRYVAFSSLGCSLVSVNSNSNASFSSNWQIYLRDTCTGAASNCNPSTIQVTNAMANGLTSEPGSHLPAISADGEYIAFVTTADIFANGIPPNDFQVYVADVSTCEQSPSNWTSCLPVLRPMSHQGLPTSASNDGACTAAYIINSPGNCGPQISKDDRFVAFVSNAKSLGVGNGNLQLFVADQCQSAGSQVCNSPQAFGPLSLSGGGQANADVITPSIDDTGRFFAFSSTATNLVSLSSANHSQVYFLGCSAPNSCTPSIRMVSTLPSALPGGLGEGGNGDSLQAAIDAAGDNIVFQSNATNLMPGVAPGTTIYQAITCALATSLCSPHATLPMLVNRFSTMNGVPSWPLPSADNSTLILNSTATNLRLGANPSGTQLVYSASLAQPLYFIQPPPWFPWPRLWPVVLTLIVVLVVLLVYRSFRKVATEEKIKA